MKEQLLSCYLVKKLCLRSRQESCCQLYYAISTKLKLDKREQHYFPVENRPFYLQKRLSFEVLLSHVKITH